jgi:hypothetical protein
VRRLRDESGFVGGFEALPFGFLVFVVGSLLLVNAWAVFDCHLAASAAAREAVRTYVESADVAAAAAGLGAATEAMEGQGKKDPHRWELSWSGDAALVRCRTVTATVTYRVPTIAVPWIGAFGRGFVTTAARHSEVVDPFRSGLGLDGFDPEACGA